MKLKSLFYFLLINIIISAATTLVVLTIWDRSHNPVGNAVTKPNPEFVIPPEAKPAENTESATAIHTYTVGEGETLDGIATANNLTIEALLAVNQNIDADSISVGDIIYLPGPSITMSEDGIAGILPDREEYPEAPMNNGLVEIASVVGAGDLDTERVYLRGLGEGTLSLTGWRLVDDDGNEYLFPQITLFSNGAVNVYSGSGVDTVVALFWNLGTPVWRPGEYVLLLDSANEIQAAFIVP